MNLFLVCLLLPVALAAPSVDLNTLKCDIQIMLDVLGSDPTEQACEGECDKLLKAGTVFNYGCPLVCHGFQNLANFFHETPKPGDQNMACGGLKLNTTAAMPTTV